MTFDSIINFCPGCVVILNHSCEETRHMPYYADMFMQQGIVEYVNLIDSRLGLKWPGKGTIEIEPKHVRILQMPVNNNAGKTWTPAEIEELRRLQHLRFDEIAEKMGRPEHGIRKALKRYIYKAA